MARLFKPMNPPLTEWSGKVVWIVGASTGIGHAVAEQLAQRGARVMVSARQSEPLQQFATQHPGAVAYPLDVTDLPALQNAVQHIVQAQGRLDLVLFAAGIYKPLRAYRFDLARMKQHLDVNVVGAYNLVDATLPTLLQQGFGHLSFVSSVAGWRGLPNSLAYGPTKAALTHFAEVLHYDLAGKGLGISAIHPGFVETPLTAQNEFTMPALITTDVAATEILAGWADGLFDIHFPKRFTWWLKLLRVLPHRWAQALIKKLTRL
jgi:NAD(P)-dependent dehydrogenase (short-subunit alcohol dehydrogenase family)